MTHHNTQSNGFTLIELMLSMAFVGILLITIATTSMHIMGTYTKGLTVKEINQSGRTISEDIQRTIAASTPFLVSPARTGSPTDDTESKYVIQPGGGRLCTGAYTYAWNYGSTAELSGVTSVPVYNSYTDSNKVIRLVKVSDLGGALCSDMSRDIESSQSKDLLLSVEATGGENLSGDRNLAVQDFTVGLGTEDRASGQALYYIKLVLGTNDQEQLQFNPSSTNCLPPNKGSGSEDFCAINQFDIIARAGNQSGSL